RQLRHLRQPVAKPAGFDCLGPLTAIEMNRQADDEPADLLTFHQLTEILGVELAAARAVGGQRRSNTALRIADRQPDPPRTVIHAQKPPGGKGGGKGVRTHLCGAPFGPFGQMSPDPFSAVLVHRYVSNPRCFNNSTSVLTAAS